MFIEALEDRRLFSVVPLPHYDPSSAVGHSSLHQAATTVGPSLLNFSIIGSYGGVYTAPGVSSGNVEMTVTSQTSKGFSGNLAFTTEDGTVISGNYKATVNKRLACKFTFRSGNTNLKCAGGIETSNLGFRILFNGKFDGTRIPRIFGGGEFAVLALLG